MLLVLLVIILAKGAGAVSECSHLVLCGATVFALVLSFLCGSFSKRGMQTGLIRSSRQVMPAIPMLFCIAMVATTWMLGGVVPTLIDYGLRMLHPSFFLVTACVVCAVISVLTGSSWSTIATIGVAFMGIGHLMGFHPGWVAGAVISGAYFGDKISPLSDTTVLASSACGVDLFKHMKYLMLTSVPALFVALVVFLVAGFAYGDAEVAHSSELFGALRSTFNITPLTLIVPALTLLLIVLRVPTLITLALSALLGFVSIFILQEHEGLSVTGALSSLWGGSSLATGMPMLDELVSTGGIRGMLPTIMLVLSAMLFGSVLMGSGMLASITGAITKRLRRRTSIVGATVCSGLFMNSATADQYHSLIVTGNMYRLRAGTASVKPHDRGFRVCHIGADSVEFMRDNTVDGFGCINPGLFPVLYFQYTFPLHEPGYGLDRLSHTFTFSSSHGCSLMIFPRLGNRRVAHRSYLIANGAGNFPAPFAIR